MERGESGAGAWVIRWDAEMGRENRLLRIPETAPALSCSLGKKQFEYMGTLDFYFFFLREKMKRVPYPVSEHSTVLHFAAIYASICFLLAPSLFKTD